MSAVYMGTVLSFFILFLLVNPNISFVFNKALKKNSNFFCFVYIIAVEDYIKSHDGGLLGI